ncbi:MAG: hypothetical protein WKG32_02945 [Gemmatimonadaceae bacterium]
MHERSREAHELFDAFVLPPGVLGYLDWSSGVTRLDCSRAEYAKLKDWAKAPSPDDERSVELAEVTVHEMHHFLQISLFGYLYRFAFTLELLISESLPSQLARLADLPTRVRNEELLRNILADFDREQPDGVSVRSIVESLTYLVQKREEYGYDTGRYIAHLRRARPLPEYMSAFLYAHGVFGAVEHTVRLFPVLAQLSLCSHSPPEALAILCQAVAAGEISTRTYLPELIAFCRERDPDYRGFSWEFPDALGQPFPDHPVYGAVRAAVQGDSQWHAPFSKYLLVPDKSFFESMHTLCMTPTLLNAEPDAAADGYREWFMAVPASERERSEEEKREKFLGALYVAGATQRMIGNVSTAPRFARRTA